jgi:hypothetical protein
MAEQQLKVVENGQYKNLYLKPSATKNQPGLEDGNHTFLVKKYVEGKERDGKYGKWYSCMVVYDGVECGIMLSAKEHDAFKVVGGEGDKIKVSLNEEKRVNPISKMKMLVPTLKFELA